ncbi:hypothetical protein TB2_008141 [Malus domestica]
MFAKHSLPKGVPPTPARPPASPKEGANGKNGNKLEGNGAGANGDPLACPQASSKEVTNGKNSNGKSEGNGGGANDDGGDLPEPDDFFGGRRITVCSGTIALRLAVTVLALAPSFGSAGGRAGGGGIPFGKECLATYSTTSVSFIDSAFLSLQKSSTSFHDQLSGYEGQVKLCKLFGWAVTRTTSFRWDAEMSSSTLTFGVRAMAWAPLPPLTAPFNFLNS